MAYMILLLLAMVHTVTASQSADEVAQPGVPDPSTCHDVIAKCKQEVSQAQLLAVDFKQDIVKLTNEMQRKVQVAGKPYKNITHAQNDVQAASSVRGMEQQQALTMQAEVVKLRGLYHRSHASFNDTMLLHLLQSRTNEAEAVQQKEAKAWQEYHELMDKLTSKTKAASSKLVGVGIEVGSLQQKISDSKAALEHANDIVDASQLKLAQMIRVCRQSTERSVHPLDGQPDEAAQAMMASLDALSDLTAEDTQGLEKAARLEKADKAQRLEAAQRDLALNPRQPQKKSRGFDLKGPDSQQQSQGHMLQSEGIRFRAGHKMLLSAGRPTSQPQSQPQGRMPQGIRFQAGQKTLLSAGRTTFQPQSQGHTPQLQGVRFQAVRRSSLLSAGRPTSQPPPQGHMPQFQGTRF